MTAQPHTVLWLHGYAIVLNTGGASRASTSIFTIFEIMLISWMAIDGHGWPFMAMHGHAWPCMAMHGHEWP